MADYLSAHWADVKPRLSILIPFHKDDPCALIARLSCDAALVAQTVEIIALDDGSNNPALDARVRETLKSCGIAARLISLEQNVGRAVGRNLLAQAARGDFFLFLDADMWPDAPGFVAAWVDYANATNPAVAFGGFTLANAPRDRRFAVHRAMATRSDCLSAEQRALQPEKHLFTSNLLVRRDVFETYGFDDQFTGWGWEDVEWAMRVSADHRIEHPAISATHLGLDTVPDLKRKYAQSAQNFARIAQLHPNIVAQYASYKAAAAIRDRGLATPVRQVSGWLAAQNWLPAQVRGFNLRVYRAALYAAALPARLS